MTISTAQQVGRHEGVSFELIATRHRIILPSMLRDSACYHQLHVNPALFISPITCTSAYLQATETSSRLPMHHTRVRLIP
jgi:hypothetical protein